MNKSAALRSEEARRAAQAAALKSKREPSAALKERAMTFAAETEKIEKLRALRLAKDAAGRADTGTIASKRSCAPAGAKAGGA
jgi:hypothetical protein